MSGFLAVDIGNSFVKIARADAHSLGEVARYPTGSAAALLEQAVLPRLPALVCSVVATESPRIVAAIEARTGHPVRVVGRDRGWPLPVALREASTLGPDRVVAAFAARALASAPVIVVSAGTAVTVDVVSEEGVFLGGAIAPGLGLLGAALATAAPALPRPPSAPDARYPGQSSVEAVQAGVAAAGRGMLRELVALASATVGARAPIVVSGGDAALARALLPDPRVRVIEDLVLRGLALLGSAERFPSAPPAS